MWNENKQCATMLLRSCDATIQDAYGASYTWKDVDMKAILGDMYDEYDYFKLSLNTFCCTTLTTSSYASHDKALCHFMTGLCWENCAYDTNSNTTKALITTMALQTNTVQSFNPVIANSENALIFRKHSPVTNINIFYNSVITPNVLSVPSNFAAGAIYTHRAYVFNIIPIKNYKKSSANLVLNSANRSSQGSTGNVDVTFNNINLRAILGQLWYEYDYFTLELVHVQTTAISATIDNSGRVCYISLSGLPFVNSSQDVSKNTNTPEANVGFIDLTGVASSIPSTTFNSSIGDVMFSKHFTVVSLRLKMISVQTLDICSITAGTFNNVNFTFKIVGVTPTK